MPKWNCLSNTSKDEFLTETDLTMLPEVMDGEVNYFAVDVGYDQLQGRVSLEDLAEFTKKEMEGVEGFELVAVGVSNKTKMPLDDPRKLLMKTASLQGILNLIEWATWPGGNLEIAPDYLFTPHEDSLFHWVEV